MSIDRNDKCDCKGTTRRTGEYGVQSKRAVIFVPNSPCSKCTSSIYRLNASPNTNANNALLQPHLQGRFQFF
jgi:hypothetical protein